NDAPRIDLAEIYTVTVGDVVELPVVVTDVDSDPITVTIEALPPDLLYVNEMIAGVVAEGAADGSPYLVVVAAEDGEGETASLEVTWVVETAGEGEPGDDGSDVSSESEGDTGSGAEPASGSEGP